MDEKLYRIAELMAPKLPYHNAGHMMNVAKACRIYALAEGLGETEVTLLETAGLLHDIDHLPGRRDNEERSAYAAREILSGLGYSPKEIEGVSRLILATKMPRNPQDILEEIICDADIDHLGRRDFFELSELLREEEGVDFMTWYSKIEPDFLSHARFYTETGKELREEKLNEYRKMLGAKMNDQERRDVETKDDSTINRRCLEKSARECPAEYVQNVLVKGFSKYSCERRGCSQVITTLAGYFGGYAPQNPQEREIAKHFLKGQYLKWARDNCFEGSLFEEGWNEFWRGLKC